MQEKFREVLNLYQSGELSEALHQAKALSGQAGPLEGNLQMLIGNISYKMGERRAAADAFLQASQLSPENAAGLLKLAITCFDAEGCIREVIEHGPEAVRLNPQDADFAYSVTKSFIGTGLRGDPTPLIPYLDTGDNRHLALIVNYYRLSGQLETLSAKLSRLLSLNPGSAFLKMVHVSVAREICDFDVIREHERLMEKPDAPEARNILAQESALARVFWCEDEAINMLPDSDSAQCALSKVPEGHSRRAFSPPGQKIRIGYLSSDFCEHATMTLFLETMASHDREKFDITLFSYTNPQAAQTQSTWPRHLAAEVVPIDNMTSERAAALISERGIDILVDLKGHTMGARLDIVNLSDAPVKVTYLGFPGSPGGVELDYAITDQIVTPDSSKPFYHQKLCRLPESYQANNSVARPRPEAMMRSDVGLPEDKFVFASFNGSLKITPRTIALWADILSKAPSSVIWIYCTRDIARRNIAAALEQSDVTRDRIIFTGNAAYPAHISRIALADLGLDAFPCNGHTTTSDMLWAGLPVLTIPGTAFASRVSTSLLNAIGLPEFICQDDRHFVEEAVRLARNPEELASLRARQTENRFIAPLFDTERLTRHLEKAYEAMSDRARAGLPPDHMDISALPPRTAPFLSR